MRRLQPSSPFLSTAYDQSANTFSFGFSLVYCIVSHFVKKKFLAGEVDFKVLIFRLQNLKHYMDLEEVHVQIMKTGMCNHLHRPVHGYHTYKDILKVEISSESANWEL